MALNIVLVCIILIVLKNLTKVVHNISVTKSQIPGQEVVLVLCKAKTNQCFVIINRGEWL